MNPTDDDAADPAPDHPPAAAGAAGFPDPSAPDHRIFQVLFEQTADAQLLLDARSNEFVACNQAAVRMLRYPGKDGMLPLHPALLSPPHQPDGQLSRDKADRMIALALAQGSHRFEWVHCSPHRAEFPVEVLLTPVRLDDRPFILVTWRDITERKEAETRLREQAAIIDQSPVAVIVADLSHRVTYCNRAALELYGRPREEVLGHTAEEVFGGETAQQIAAGRAATYATGHWSGRVSFVTSDGQLRVAEFHMGLLTDGEGRPQARLSLAVDITEKARLEEQFLRSQRMENLGQLAAGIAHDLNNILSPVLMAAPLLRLHTTRSEDRRILDAVEKSAERGGALVKQILAFARGAGSERLLLQPKHILREVGELMTDTFPKNIRLEIDIPSDLWTMHANPTQLHQIVLNLCINARDAMPAGGTLTLRARNDPAPPPGIVIEVGDTGVGIPSENRGRIFEPFFTTKGEHGGTGLGLATVRGIIAGHQGRIDLESSPGFGSTFRVWLPASGDEIATTGLRGSRRPFSIRGNGELILVVDDDPGISEIVAQILVKSGFRVLAAHDGAEMLDRHLGRLPEAALALLDIDLPGQDGLSFGRILQRIHPEQRVLFMTGYGGTPGGARLVPPPGCPVLKKPFTGDELLGAVQTALADPPFAL